MTGRSSPGARVDLRVLALAAVAWLAALPGGSVVPLVLAAALGLWALLLRGRRGSSTLAGWALVGLAVSGATLVRADADGASPMPQLARENASVSAVVRVSGAPLVLPGRFGTRVAVDAEVRDLTVRDRRVRLRAPVRVVLDGRPSDVRRGAVLRIRGSLRTTDRGEPELVGRGPPELVTGPGVLERGAARVRAGVRRAVADRADGPRALVPALVDGEDGALDRATVDDFRTSGLTHLLAVSGTNLTLILGVVLALARGVGVRARGLVVAGALGIVGFVLLAGPEPSVLRAAAMGSLAVLGMGAGGVVRGLRLLGGGVLGLLLVDPSLARSAGFALSVLATGGILLLAPVWAAALGRWLPRWAAEAVAVPLAAQVACTPLVAVISSSVSLVAVGANLVAAPLVAPATVCGLLGGLAALVWPPLGALLALPGAWCAAGIIAVARRAADLEMPAVAWGTGSVAIGLLTVLCLALALGLHRVLARPVPVLALCTGLGIAVAVPLPTPGWPPPGWVLVACSVGQGDGLVLAAGAGSAVVVDAGPDPDAIDGCLRRLAVRAVPALVLTHFHADHVDGLPGVLRGRRVGEVLTSPHAEPAGSARTVARLAARARVPVRPVTVGEGGSVGPLRWQVLAPGAAEFSESDSPPNDASVVLLVETRGVRLLLMGDQERPSQAALRRDHPDLRADVLKVAHHGSSKQDETLLTRLGARIAVVSAGVGNDYGHPAGATLDLLARAGIAVRRTDRDGDVAVLVDGRGRLGSVAHPVRDR